MARRTDAEIMADTLPFAIEDRRRTWRLLLSTLLAQAVAMTTTFLLPLWAKPLGALVIALLMVRLFMFAHDAGHGAIFADSPLGTAFIWVISLYTLNAPPIWRDGHGLHHRTNAMPLTLPLSQYNTAQLLNRMIDAPQWQQMTPRERWRYRLVRHPLLIVFGWLTVFAIGSCLVPFFRSPTKNWLALVGVLLYSSVAVGVALSLGLSALFWVLLLPNVIGSMIGVYLFVAQHRYPDMKVAGTSSQPDLVEGALHGSSYFEMPALMRWFTGNIGYHHVHHLNHRIPFYRLPEAMAAIEELQSPTRTSFAPGDVMGVLRSHVWDPEARRVISFAAADRWTKR